MASSAPGPNSHKGDAVDKTFFHIPNRLCRFGGSYRFAISIGDAVRDITNDERRFIQAVLEESERCAAAPTQQPAWRLRSALSESARIIRQLLDEMPIG